MISVKSISPRDELIALIDGIVPRAEFYTRERRFFRPPDSVFLTSEDYRTEHYRVRLDTFIGERKPIPSDFIRPAPDHDRFPEEQFNRLVALVEQLLDRYTDPETHRFVAVLPATRVYQDNLCNSAEHFSKAIVRSAFLFGIPETVDAVLRLMEGETSKYTQVVVLDGVSISHNGEEVELWPDARLIEWHQAFGDPRHESPLGIPDAVVALASRTDFNKFSFGRGNTLLCIDRTGGPIIRRSENLDHGPGGSYDPVSLHKFSTAVAISAVSLTVNHPIFEVCSWYWYDAKVQSLLGYRNELDPDQNLDVPRLLAGRTIESENGPDARNIYECCLTSTCILTSVWENPRTRFVPGAADRSQQGHINRKVALVAALGLTEPGRLPGLTKPVSCK